MKFKKSLKIVLPSLALLSVPLIATSCGSVYTTKLKYLNPDDWKDNGKENTYATLSNSSVSVKDAIYGSNFNDGNYIFLFGSTGNSDATDIANLLYGPNGNDAIGNIGVDMDKNMNFSTSQFLPTFFSAGTGEGTGGLGSKNSPLGFSVSLLMFIDFAPYNPDATGNSGKSGADGPLDKYTQDEVLAEWQEKDEGVSSLNDLPKEAQAKIGTYKRNDESAIQYRNLVNYMNAIRPGAANVSTTSGLIAFKNGKNPQTFAISDPSSLNSSLLTYYKTS